MWQYNVCAKSFDCDGFTSYIKLENSRSVENKSSRELQFLVPFFSAYGDAAQWVEIISEGAFQFSC